MSKPSGSSPDSLFARAASQARAETGAGLVQVEWREDEIVAAIGRHPEAENDLWHSNRIVLPGILSAAWETEFVFRGHAREILERVAAGADTRPGTAAECCIAMSAVSMAVPMHGAAAGFYFRMWRQAFPGHLAFDPGLADHYEVAHGPGMDRHERYVRRKLLVPGRRLDSARIECDGEHRGKPVTCKYHEQGRD